MLRSLVGSEMCIRDRFSTSFNTRSGANQNGVPAIPTIRGQLRTPSNKRHTNGHLPNCPSSRPSGQGSLIYNSTWHPKVVNDLIQWGRTCGLKFNPEKTVCIIFNKAKQITSYPNKLLVSGQQVEFSTTTKYLGVHLDHKLLWTTHITQALKKAKAYLFMILKNAVSYTHLTLPTIYSV